MATVTVAQNTVTRTSQWKPAAFGVQRYLRQNFTAAERTTILQRLAGTVEFVLQHWSGGIPTLNWNFNDFAPVGSTSSSRVWSNTPKTGLDTIFAHYDEFKTYEPNAKMVLVLHDHPGVMVTPNTRTVDSNQYPPWPAPAKWGGNPNCAGALASELLSRYAGKIYGFSYGQEGKGLSVRTNATELQNFRDGFTAFATYMRANHAGIQLWYPHLNYFATEGTIANRRVAMDALLAGGGLSANDQTMLDGFLAGVNPAHVDRITYDVSVVDNNASDTWRGDLANIRTRLHLERELVRAIRDRVAFHWGEAYRNIAIVAIETYVDVRVGDAEYSTYPEAVQAAFSTAIAMHAMGAGVSQHLRWEPHGGTPGNETIEGNLFCWWDEATVAFKGWDQIKALATAIPAGTDLVSVTSDNANIVAVSSKAKMFVVNIGAVAETVSVAGTAANPAPVSVPAYDVATIALPAPAANETITVRQSKSNFGTGGAPGTVTLTFDQPTLVDSVGMLYCSISQNGPAVRQFPTPSGWTPVSHDGGALAVVDNAADMRIQVFKKKMLAGETSVAITPDVTARDHAVFQELVGADFDAFNKVSVTQNESGTTLSSGANLAPAAGWYHGCYIVNKNADAQTWAGEPTGVLQAYTGMLNEAGAASSQKITAGLYYGVEAGAPQTMEAHPTIPVSRNQAGVHVLVAPKASAPSGTTKSGAAVIAGSSTVAATGQRKRSVSTVVAGQATVAATGSRVRKGAVLIAGVGTMAASGTEGGVAKFGQVTIAGSSSLTATPSVSGAILGAAVIAGSSTLAAAGTVYREVRGAVTIAGSSVISAVGSSFRAKKGQATIAGSSSLTAVGTRGRRGKGTTSIRRPSTGTTEES